MSLPGYDQLPIPHDGWPQEWMFPILRKWRSVEMFRLAERALRTGQTCYQPVGQFEDTINAVCECHDWALRDSDKAWKSTWNPSSF